MGSDSLELGLGVGIGTGRRSGKIKLASGLMVNFLWWRQQMERGSHEVGLCVGIDAG